MSNEYPDETSKRHPPRVSKGYPDPDVKKTYQKKRWNAKPRKSQRRNKKTNDETKDSKDSWWDSKREELKDQEKTKDD